MSRKEKYYKKCSCQRFSQITFMNQTGHTSRYVHKNSIIKWFSNWRYEQKPGESYEGTAPIVVTLDGTRMWHHGHQQSMWKCFSVHQSLENLVCLEAFPPCHSAISSEKDENRLLQMWESLQFCSLVGLLVPGFQVSKLKHFQGVQLPVPAPGSNEFGILI